MKISCLTVMFFLIMNGTEVFGGYGTEAKIMNGYVVRNSDSLYTTVYESQGKETVIMLHGGPGFPDDLKEVSTALAEQFRVITFHQRGTGMSPCKSNDYSMAAYIEDVNSVAANYGLDKFHLFGHSWGGLYAQLYAEKHPEKLLSLFLCCPAAGTGSIWQQTQKEVLAYNRSKCTSAQWMGMGFNSLLGMLGSNRAYSRLFARVMYNYNKDYKVCGLDSFKFENLRAKPINQTLKEIKKAKPLNKFEHKEIPVTIVFGSNDIYKTVHENVIGRYPFAKAITIADCGHIPWLHNREAFRVVLMGHYNSNAMLASE